MAILESKMLKPFGLLLIGSGVFFSIFETYAVTSTAWYKVENIKHVLKLVDNKCIDGKDEKCARTQFWRVYYKATSQYSPVQTFQETFTENVPQLGVVKQMTVKLPQKKAAMMQP